MIFKKLKAGALQLTLFIAVVVALLLMAFIGIVHTHQRFNLQTDFVVHSVENSNKGIEYALQHDLQLKDTFNINVEEDYTSLKVFKDYWGIYERTIAISKIKNYRFQKTALIGSKQPTTDRLALFVEDNNQPLVVVGNTKIQGVAYLPQRGVKSGNIAGHSYYGEQLIYGTIRTSRSLPKLTTSLLEQIDKMAKKNQEISQEYFLDINKRRIFSNSFSEPTQMIFSNSLIELSSITLTGNIVVQSQTKIVVGSTSKLTDVLLIAPEIEIMDNVSGSFQANATTKIVVGENCVLNYPTALVLGEKEFVLQQQQQQQPQQSQQQQNAPPPQQAPPSQQAPQSSPEISVGNGSIIKGVVLYFGKININNHKPQIVVEENATIIGEIYCNMNLELKGSVSGTVYTSNFVTNQSGSIYQNHIYNGRILVDELPQEYVGLEFENSKKEVIKWLY